MQTQSTLFEWLVRGACQTCVLKFLCYFHHKNTSIVSVKFPLFTQLRLQTTKHKTLTQNRRFDIMNSLLEQETKPLHLLTPNLSE